MRLILTTCCKNKQTQPEPLPAIERYLSPRIHQVYQISQGSQTRFAIFSGKYGLVYPETLIPFYDHLLRENEAEGMIKLLISQLEQSGIHSIGFYVNTIENDPSIAVYRKTLADVCRRMKIDLELIELPYST